MKSIKVICPTYRAAVYAWETAQKTMPSLWIKRTKNPLTLVSGLTGNQYEFDIDSSRSLLGWHSDTIIYDEFIGLLDESKDIKKKQF